MIGKNSEWTFSVFGTSCSYGFGEGTQLGTITGGSEPVLSINTVLPRTAGNTVLCPSTGRLTAAYLFTEPHAIFVGEVMRTSLFTDKAQTIRYPTGTTIDLSIESGSSSRFTSGSETVATCTESTAKGKTPTAANAISLEALTWGGCSQTTDTLATGELEIVPTSGGNAEVIGQESRWTFGIFGTSCSYGLGEGIKLGTLVGGETPTLKIETSIPRTAGGILCPAAVTWDANYVVTEPHALYVSS